jgi:hypothetical protein
MNSHIKRLLTIATAVAGAMLLGAVLPSLLTEPQHLAPVEHQHSIPTLVVEVPQYHEAQVQ